jgi:tripartite-type tricarboxylate transporter receptor subunit TctC
MGESMNNHRSRLRAGFCGYHGCILFTACLLFVFSAQSGYGQENIAKYPSRPITLIEPTPPGSEADIPVRLIAKSAEKFLGQTMVIVNKAGGSQAIGIAATAAAKPDGYTIGHAGHPGLFFAPLMDKVPYHPVKDIKQIMQFGYLNIAVTVKGDSPFQGFKDIVEFARKNPKKLTYGTAGSGTAGNLLMEQIARKEKVQFTHIPFKGSPETQAALMGGHILVGTGGFTHSLVEDKQIRLVLLIAEKRSSEYPQVPILSDLGYDIPAPMLLNIVGPKGLPQEIVKKLDDAFAKAMNEPMFFTRMKELRLTMFYRNSQDLEKYVAENYEAFSKIISEMGLAK